MSKIIKAQAGVAVRAIPVQRYPAINVGEIVSNLTKNGAEVGREAISIGSRIGKGALKILSGPLGILALALSGDMDAQQPHSEMGRLQETRNLTKRAIPVYGRQSDTSTPVMGKKKKTTKARPTITRTPDKESTSVPAGSGAIAGSEDAAQRDTVRVINGAAVENATPQDTVKVQHKNTENTEQTTDDRNILQKLGDRWARRKRQNNSTPNQENKPPRNWRDKAKTGLKWGMYGFIANEADNKIFGGGVKKIVKGVLDLGFDKPDTVYVQQSAKNGVQQKQAKSVQNDTTQTYNGFLINQQNLVE